MGKTPLPMEVLQVQQIFGSSFVVSPCCRHATATATLMAVASSRWQTLQNLAGIFSEFSSTWRPPYILWTFMNMELEMLDGTSLLLTTDDADSQEGRFLPSQCWESLLIAKLYISLVCASTHVKSAVLFLLNVQHSIYQNIPILQNQNLSKTILG